MSDNMDVETSSPEASTSNSSDAEGSIEIISNNLLSVEQAVYQFDARFTLRALRSISSIRKSEHFEEALAFAINASCPPGGPMNRDILWEAMGHTPDGDVNDDWIGNEATEPMPEIWVYLAIIVQVYLYDAKKYAEGAKFSSLLVSKIRDANRRTSDPLGAKAYFYYYQFHEQLDPKPPSRQSPVFEARQMSLKALTTSVVRKDLDTQAVVTVLLLRHYISVADITQADLLVAQTKFPQNAPNNQVCRYLYYLGRIRAIQLSYTAAHEHLVSATRKSPTSNIAAGFYQSAMKLQVVVELLMGDIPERAIFRQPSLERALYAYLRLVQAVRVGDLQAYLKVVEEHAPQFRKDGTYTLILRLRQNVIKTGVRMLSSSYSRISSRDICLRSGVESEESAEYIVAKAIRDGVIEATLDHEHGFMESKQAGDTYATKEPAEAFHERINACLGIHDECVMAMRYPMNKHRQELKNAQEARERERELAKEIQEGDIDEDDAGEGFEGM